MHLGTRTAANVSCFRCTGLEGKRLFNARLRRTLSACVHTRGSADGRAGELAREALAGEVAGSAGYAEEAVGGFVLACTDLYGANKQGVSVLGRQGKGEVLLSADKHLALSDLSLSGTRAR